MALALNVACDDDAVLVAPDGGASDGGPRFRIEPAMPTLTVAPDAQASVDLQLVYGTGDQAQRLPARWELERERLGRMDDDGRFVSTRNRGGRVQVRAVATNGTGEAETTITVVLVDVGGPLEDARRREVEGLDGARHAQRQALVRYPLAGAVMPHSVPAPAVQWDRSRAGDLVRIVLTSPYAELHSYLRHDDERFPRAHAPARARWARFADSSRGQRVTLRVDRLASGANVWWLGEPRSFSLTYQGVFGSAYYWEVRSDPDRSRVLRLSASGGELEEVLERGPQECHGCHALSDDGDRLAVSASDGGGAFTTEVYEVFGQPGEPRPTAGPFEDVRSWSFASQDPGLAVASVPDDGGVSHLRWVDLETGTLTGGGGLPSSAAGYPAFSPVRDELAYMAGGSDGVDGTDRPTRIEVASFEEPSTGPRVLHRGESLASETEGGATDSHPSWSPDGAVVAFAHGPSSVSRADGTGAPPSALYLVARDAGQAIRLEAAMGPSEPPKAFWPVFAPFVSQEPDGTTYYWLAFYSRRDYGNERAGTAGTGRRQLWVSAIDLAAFEAGADPSHVPYWVPGQDRHRHNLAPFWSPDACREDGARCDRDAACCSGRCEAGTCAPPTQCRSVGRSCALDSHCCDELQCERFSCRYPPLL